MALINNNLVFVEDENVTRETESSSHPVEKGVPLTDHVKRKPVEISIKGKIGNTTGHNGKKASDIINNIINLQNSGSLIKYVGRNAAGNMQIQSFNTSHPNTVWGGCEFDMVLKEVRIAQPAYKPPAVKKTAEKKSAGTQQVSNGDSKNVYHTVKKGDTIWKLVTKTYKSLDPKYSKTMDKCNWVMSKNPSAFSRKGDFGTLKVGAKILIGVKK